MHRHNPARGETLPGRIYARPGVCLPGAPARGQTAWPQATAQGSSFGQSTETGARARQDAADGLEYGFWALPGVCQADRLLWNDWLKMEYQTDARAGNVPLAESWYAVRPGAAVAAARPG